MTESFVFDKAKWHADKDGCWLMLRIDRPQAAITFCANKENKLYSADIKRYYQKRSLEANRQLWVFIDKLAVEQRMPPIEVYRKFVRDLGGNSTIVPIKENAVNEWERIWASHGIGWFCESWGKTRNFPEYENIICYHGSSAYDSKTMSRLIDSVVEECENCDIETLPPEKLALLKAGLK